MPVATCPFCHAFASMEVIPESGRTLKHDRHALQAAFECTGCDRIVIGLTMEGLGMDTFVDPSQPASIADHMERLPDSAFTWEPAHPVGREFADVPAEIAIPAGEAVACRSVGLNRSAVMMARAVIEASAKQHGVKSGSLFDKIDRLVQDGLIRGLLGDAAHEVRIAGNDMAHGDFATTQVSGDDADEILALMEDFLSELFQLPRRIAARREKREAAREAAKNEP